MSNIPPNIKMLMKSIMVSENAIVGSVRGAESTIIGLLKAIADTEVQTENIEVTTEKAEILKEGTQVKLLQKLPISLVGLAKKELESFIPDESQIKSWFLHDEDFSGITFYHTTHGELTFASIARGVDLSSGYQYADNRYQANAYSEALCSGDMDKIQIAESVMKANLPGKKIKYCHWISNKPSKPAIEGFKLQNSQFFPSI